MTVASEWVRDPQPDLSTRLMSLIADQQDQIFALATAAEERQLELRRLMATVRGTDSRHVGLETLSTLEEVRGWLADHAGRVRTEAVAMAPGGGQRESTLAQGRPLDEAALARGVRLRTLYLTSATRAPATRRQVQALTELGAEYRTVASLPLRMFLMDDEVALLPLQVDASGHGAIVVRTRATILALRALFETYWENALPFGRQQGSTTLTDQERLVVTMLAEGAHDQEVAQALGVSVRTVRRMVASLSERVSARSRFQAGVNAVRAGWLD